MAACQQSSNTWWVPWAPGLLLYSQVSWCCCCSLSLSLQTLREQRCGNGGRANCDVSVRGPGRGLAIDRGS